MKRTKNAISVLGIILLFVINVVQYNTHILESENYERQIMDLTKRIEEYETNAMIINNVSNSSDKTQSVNVNEFVNRIKLDLKLQSSKSEIEAVLGTDCVKVEKAEGELAYLWRYDLIKRDSYQYAEKMDSLDVDGMTAGDVGVVVFLEYNSQDKLLSYSMYYTGVEKDSIYEFRVTEGSSLETKIR